jgi:hypothetical protein
MHSIHCELDEEQWLAAMYSVHQCNGHNVVGVIACMLHQVLKVMVYL